VRSVREECLNHLILSSEEQLRYALSEYLPYYHHERIRPGLHKIIEPQHEGSQGEIICIERVGGLLKSYHRKAAWRLPAQRVTGKRCAPSTISAPPRGSSERLRRRFLQTSPLPFPLGPGFHF
jgi:hypothetical protein